MFKRGDEVEVVKVPTDQMLVGKRGIVRRVTGKMVEVKVDGIKTVIPFFEDEVKKTTEIQFAREVKIIKANPGLNGVELKAKARRLALKDAEDAGLIVFRDGGWYVK